MPDPSGRVTRLALVAQARAARNSSELLRAAMLSAPARRRVDDLGRQLDALVRALEADEEPRP